MNFRSLIRVFAAMALLCGFCLASATQSLAAPKPADAKSVACKQACLDCQQACLTCQRHCESMATNGKTEHRLSERLAEDCAEICGVAAKITGRQGPDSAAICEACIKACEACGAECKKSPNMKPMKDCSVACEKCAKACHDMISASK